MWHLSTVIMENLAGQAGVIMENLAGSAGVIMEPRVGRRARS